MAEQRTVNPLVVGSSPTSPAMIQLIKKLFLPGPFDPDLRLPIIVVVSIIFYIRNYIKRNWDYIQDELDSDWE